MKWEYSPRTLGRLEGIARKFGLDEESARDVAVDTYLWFWEAGESYDLNTMFDEAARRARNMRRQQRQKITLQPQIDDDGEEIDPIDWLRRQPATQEDRLFCLEILKWVERLPKKHQRLLELRVDGANLLEISKETGHPIDKVLEMLEEAREYLMTGRLYEGDLDMAERP